MLIDNLIQQYEQSIAQELNAKQAEGRAIAEKNVAELRAEFVEWAGEAWSEIAPYTQDIVYVYDGKPTGKVGLRLNLQPLKLSPCEIWRARRGGTTIWSVEFDGRAEVGFGQFAEFLVSARSYYESWLKSRVDQLRVKVRALFAGESPYPQELHAAFVELTALAPASVAVLQAEAEQRRKNAEQRKAEQAEQERQKGIAAEAYRAAFADYWVQRQRVLDHNDAVIDRWRAQIEKPFEVIRIRIGFVGEGEDGDGPAILETITTLGQDAEGYWLEIEHGLLHRWKHSNIVATSAPVQIQPGENGYLACALYVGDAEIHGDSWMLYAPPVLDRSEYTTVIEQITEELQPVPAAPERPDLLSRSDCVEVERRVLGKEQDEIPF